MPAGKFVIKKGRTGQFRFSLVGRNGQIVATSETYTTKASCMNGIKAVKTLAGGAAIEDQTTKAWAEPAGEYQDGHQDGGEGGQEGNRQGAGGEDRQEGGQDGRRPRPTPRDRDLIADRQPRRRAGQWGER